MDGQEEQDSSNTVWIVFTEGTVIYCLLVQLFSVPSGEGLMGVFSMEDSQQSVKLLFF